MLKNVNAGVLNLALPDTLFTPSYLSSTIPLPDMSFMLTSINENEHNEVLLKLQRN